MFMLGALALGITSCEDAPAVPPMQENEQGPVLETSALKIDPTPFLSSGQTINLDNYINNSEEALFKVNTDELPEGIIFQPYVELASTPEFDDDIVTVPLEVKGDEVMGDLGAWHDAHTSLYGIAEQGEQTVYYRVAANLATAPVEETEETEAQPSVVISHFGGPDYYLASGSLKEIPMVSIMPSDFLYTPGSWNSWNASASQFLFAKGENEEKFYYGCVMVSGEGFKITNTTDWSGDNYGIDNGKLSLSGGNIPPSDGAGLYWMKANLNTLDLTMQRVTAVGVIGGGNWDNDQALTPNEDYTVWTGDVTLDGEWKIRFNGSWDFNYGGALKNPEVDGPNFAGTGGAATVTVTFSGHNPVIKVVAK